MLTRQGRGAGEGPTGARASRVLPAGPALPSCVHTQPAARSVTQAASSVPRRLEPPSLTLWLDGKPRHVEGSGASASSSSCIVTSSRSPQKRTPEVWTNSQVEGAVLAICALATCRRRGRAPVPVPPFPAALTSGLFPGSRRTPSVRTQGRTGLCISRPPHLTSPTATGKAALCLSESFRAGPPALILVPRALLPGRSVHNGSKGGAHSFGGEEGVRPGRRTGSGHQVRAASPGRCPGQKAPRTEGTAEPAELCQVAGDSSLRFGDRRRGPRALSRNHPPPALTLPAACPCSCPWRSPRAVGGGWGQPSGAWGGSRLRAWELICSGPEAGRRAGGSSGSRPAGLTAPRRPPSPAPAWLAAGPAETSVDLGIPGNLGGAAGTHLPDQDQMTFPAI